MAIDKPQVLGWQPIRIGCAGWNIPRQFATGFVSSGSHLERYSQTFNACEINSSFYRHTKRKPGNAGRDPCHPTFKFSVKVPRAITHEAKLNCSSDLLTTFLEQIISLREKLGPILIQLPPSFEFDPIVANKFLSLLRRNYSGDVVWEPRHPTRFNDRVNSLLKAFHVARVAADPACVPPAGSPAGAPGLAYFRLHGSPRLYFWGYEDDFPRPLQTQLEDLSAQGRVCCIFDNTALGFATPDALALRAKLKQSRLSEARGVA